MQIDQRLSFEKTLSFINIMKYLEIAGHSFQALNTASFCNLIQSRIRNTSSISPMCITLINMHCLALLKKHPKFNKFYKDTEYVYIDGMPIIWMLKMLGQPFNSSYRLTVLDWHHHIFNVANINNCTVFLLGGKEGIAEKASKYLGGIYPKLKILSHHGYLEDSIVPNTLLNESIDILLVGMGMPIEEEWILANRSQLTVKIIIPVGGYFDYIAGNSYTPPRWTGRVGLEWLFRLGSSPLRLGHRYLIEPWPVIIRFFYEFFKRRK